MEFEQNNSEGVDVAELLVATAGHADEAISPAVADVLRLVREKMNLELVFVRAYRPCDERDAASLTGPATPDPLEAAWGEHMLSDMAGQSAAVAGTHQYAPVVLSSGAVYGTLCAFSRGEWTVRSDLKILQSTAKLVAHKVEEGARPAAGANGQRQPQQPLRRSIFSSEATIP